jgi:hypothetical protein
MNFTTKMRYALINSTRGYFSTAHDLMSEYDIPYYEGEDFFDRKHRLNVHYHALPLAADEGQSADENDSLAAPKLPVVVFIHGGGWKRGDRNYVFDVYNNFAKSIAAYLFLSPTAIARFLTVCPSKSEGFVCVVPSYRLSMPGEGGIQHPTHARDVAHALRVPLRIPSPVSFYHRLTISSTLQWVKDNIHKYNGDTETVFLSGTCFALGHDDLVPDAFSTSPAGHSAGGHLAALLTLNVAYLASVGLEPDFVKGVVGICGVYDLVTGYKRYMVPSPQKSPPNPLGGC